MFYYSFTFKLPVKQHWSDFSPLKPGKTMLISPEKLHNSLHNSPILSHNFWFFLTPYQTAGTLLAVGIYVTRNIK